MLQQTNKNAQRAGARLTWSIISAAMLSKPGVGDVEAAVNSDEIWLGCTVPPEVFAWNGGKSPCV
jgi:hypothetical protein